MICDSCEGILAAIDEQNTYRVCPWCGNLVTRHVVTRVAGEALCSCGKPYSTHPRLRGIIIPTLRKDCNGRVVKI